MVRRFPAALPAALLGALLVAGALPAAPAMAAPTAKAPAGTLTKAPELVTFVEAPFPEAQKGHTGSVVLAVTIRADGTVEDATVTESAGEDFDAAAVAAVKQFVFSPAEIDGKPARIRILYKYDFVEKVELPTTAIYTGTVLDADSHGPVPGVTVTLADGRSAVTDAEGRFTFTDVPPGTEDVSLSGERLTALSTEETFVAGQKLEATYEVSLQSDDAEGGGDDMEILVSAPALQRQAISTEIPAEEARKVPGTQGDVLRVVENLPGVARASLGTGALVVWGAAPGDTGVYVDGVPVPRLYHDGGLRSVVGSDLVKAVELVPGGYAAPYGRAVGGLVSVSTQHFTDGQHGALSADLYDGSAAAHGPLGEHFEYEVGGRYGYAGPLLTAFYPDVEDYFPIPHYWDAQVRFGARLRSGETLDLTGLFSSDYTRSTAPNSDPSRQASEEKGLTFQRVSLRYVHDVGDGSTVTALVYVGGDQTDDVNTFGAVDTSVRTRVTQLGGRAGYRARLARQLTLEAGLDVNTPTTAVTQEGSVAYPPREGDVRVFGQAPPDQIASDAFTVQELNVAPFVEADASLLGDTLLLTPGLRLDPYARSVSRARPQTGDVPVNGLFEQDLRLEPRLSVRYAPAGGWYVTGAAGLYGQQPEATDLSASFGNPALPAERATHYVLGGGARPVPLLSVDVTGFYTRSSQLATRSDADQPASGEALVASGLGRTYGGQAMVRLDPVHGFYGWLSYTLSWSERQDTPEEAWRPSDYDQRHVLTGLGGYQLPFGLDVGVRARVATGYPRTPVTGAYYDNRRDLYEPLFGEQNSERLPTFFQADLRVARTFDIRQTKLDVSLEIQNVTNQSNVEEYVYSADYTTRGAITGLPILPVLGARWSF